MASNSTIDYRIAPETSTDHGPIREVLTGAFDGPIEADLVDALRLRKEYLPDLALVSREPVSERIIGFILLFPLGFECDDGPRRILSLAPLAVREGCQGKGAGAALVNAAIQAAWAGDHDAILVLGDPPYYERFGFEPAHTRGLVGPYSGAGPAFQVLLRDPERPCAGQAVYPPEFDGV